MFAIDYQAVSERLRTLCLNASGTDVDEVFAMLNDTTDLPTTKAIDFHLGAVDTPDGVARVEHYLFHGTQMQRNYCTLFFARRNDWELINQAYHLGLIDRAQAFSRQNGLVRTLDTTEHSHAAANAA